MILQQVEELFLLLVLDPEDEVAALPSRCRVGLTFLPAALQPYKYNFFFLYLTSLVFQRD